VERVAQLEAVEAPLSHDRERFRWYADGGESCLVLTRYNDLLEPFPTFGPDEYRLLARDVRPREAHAYALAHGFPHFRNQLA
jgi:hypothetical protein